MIPIRPLRKRPGWPVWVVALAAACLMPSLALRAQEKPAPSKPSSQPAQQTPQAPPPAGLKLQNPSTGPAQSQKPQPAPPAGKIQLQAPSVEKVPKPAAPAQTAQVLIEAIVFRGNRRIPDSTLRARIFSRPGQVYNVNEIERDFMALWNTGYFDDIRAVASDGKTGKIITFFVREKKLVRSIDYKGMSSVSVSDVMDRFRQEKVGLSIMSQFDPVIIRRAEVVLEEMLSENGRQFATVHARTRDIPPDSVALTFIVVEGPKVKVGKVRFKGNTAISSARLIEAMKYSKPIGLPPWFWILHRTYNKDKVDADLEKIRELYQERG
ncbi:MAG: outer membrane protein assembly factor BamA, partial [Acidobacteriota bacterium]|nr:outer membrane protein assembly factor BamA [Acidobacteriota bacterium]